MTSHNNDLLPCPFCGGPATLGGLPGGFIGQVYCRNDECFGPKTTALTKADSIKQWNTRSSTAPADGAREALERLLACPVIADENHTDPEWGDSETANAVNAARRALRQEPHQRAQRTDGGVVADTPSNETATDVRAHPSPMGSRSCDEKTIACGVAGVAPGPSGHAAGDTTPRPLPGREEIRRACIEQASANMTMDAVSAQADRIADAIRARAAEGQR